jgi:hypothetical protein
MVEGLGAFNKNGEGGATIPFKFEEEKKVDPHSNTLIQQEHSSASVLSQMDPITAQNKWT